MAKVGRHLLPWNELGASEESAPAGCGPANNLGPESARSKSPDSAALGPKDDSAICRPALHEDKFLKKNCVVQCPWFRITNSFTAFFSMWSPPRSARRLHDPLISANRAIASARLKDLSLSFEIKSPTTLSAS